MRQRLLVICIFFLAGGFLFGHPNDVATVTLTHYQSAATQTHYFDGKAYINGYVIAQLAQQYNLDPALLAEYQLRNVVWSYFDYHFVIEGKNGIIYKEYNGVTSVNPAEFLSTGLYLQFNVAVQGADYPLSFSSDMYAEFSTTPVVKVLFTDKNGKLIENSAEVLLTPKKSSFIYDPAMLDFSGYRLNPLDSDHDGLPDAFETLYGLKPFSRDSDNDSYSDFEEMFMGWDPFSDQLAINQSFDSLQDALDTFAAEYRRKPTWKNAIHSLYEQIQFKYTDEDSQSVVTTLEYHQLEKQQSSEQVFFKQFLDDSEHDLYKAFDLRSFFFLLAFALLLGFLHTGSSGPGKGILIAFMTKEDRDFKSGFIFSAAFALVHIIASILVSVLVHLVIQPAGMDSNFVLYCIQLASGGALFAYGVIFILRAIRKLREKIIVSKKTFFDLPAGTIALSGITALGTSPYLLAIIDFYIEIEKPLLIPVFFLAFGIGIAACLFVVALAVLGIRHIVFDIFPRFLHYAELSSSILCLIFALFFLFPVIPF